MNNGIVCTICKGWMEPEDIDHDFYETEGYYVCESRYWCFKTVGWERKYTKLSLEDVMERIRGNIVELDEL